MGCMGKVQPGVAVALGFLVSGAAGIMVWREPLRGAQEGAPVQERAPAQEPQVQRAQTAAGPATRDGATVPTSLPALPARPAQLAAPAAGPAPAQVLERQGLRVA